MIRKQRIIVLFVLIMQSMVGQELIDLEKNVPDFIVETKQIIIPEFPGAFNASIVRWKDSLLLCFRIRDEHMISIFEMGFVWLDDNFNPISKPQILEIRGNNPSSFSQNQDPRLITIDERLYIIYSNFIKIGDIIPRRMFIAEVHENQTGFFIENPLCLHPFEGWSKRWEKNWTPFIHDGNLLLAYSLLPHRILQPSLETGECKTISSTYSLIDWNWGELRGGTPPALINSDEYIAFFHSSKDIATVHSQGKKMPHYVMGAYTFSANPPFAITHISPEPIVGKNFYTGTSYTTWKPLRVVFPVGCIADEHYLWVTYGRQDFEIWVVKIDKKNLYKSLIPCPITDKQFEYPNTYQTDTQDDPHSGAFIDPNSGAFIDPNSSKRW